LPITQGGNYHIFCGEPIPEELFLAMVRAIQRGVEIKMIAQNITAVTKSFWKTGKRTAIK